MFPPNPIPFVERNRKVSKIQKVTFPRGNETPFNFTLITAA